MNSMESATSRQETGNDRASFERQYNNPKNITVADGTLQIYHAVPEKKADNFPIMLGHGFPANPTAMRENLYPFFHAGKEVLFPFTPEGIQITQEIKDANVEMVDRQAEVELRKASAFLKVIEEEKLENIDGIGFSEGAIHIVTAALINPKKFRNIVLVNPAGVMGKTNFFNFVLGALKHVALEKRKLAEAVRTGRYLRSGELDERVAPEHDKSPGFVSGIQSKLAIPKSDILDALAELERNGVGVTIIHTEDDQIYPLAKIKKMLAEKKLSHLLKVEKGSHTAFSSNPEKFWKLITAAFNDLEKQKQAVV